MPKKIFLIIALMSPSILFAQSSAVKQVQLKQFNLQSSAVIKDAGAILSSLQYKSADYWFPVNVPCTVLTGLVQNKIYADPYIGMNNMLIPDASDSFNHQYNLEQYSFLPGEPNPWKKPYWYKTSFEVPAADKDKIFQLIFKGINYRAEVWLNGQLIADSSQMAGMFAEYYLDVTKAVTTGVKNILAVKIYPLDEPGLPAKPQLTAMGDFYENGGPTGDIGKNVTMLCSVGWDWLPEVHDRNMGIWLPVYLRTTGKVIIQQPHIVTELPNLPDTGLAKLSLGLLLNNKANTASNGKLKITVTPETFKGEAFSIEQHIILGAADTREIELNADEIKQLIINKPHLWWPNNYGNPDLYRIRIQYISANSISDDTSFLFGIRTVSSTTTKVNGWVRRDFLVNGRKVHLVGGAWVPDMMLNRDAQRYDDELRLCRNGNVNLVRIWGGGLGETDDFYASADKYGLLVWQDFWVTGDTHGEFKGSKDYPPDGSIFIKNIVSTILRIRNHASLLVWTGGNEGHARKELYDAMRDNVATLDGTRPFIPSSSGFASKPSGWKGSWPDDEISGVYSGGSYKWEDPATYYKLVDNGKDWVFKDETGIPSQPPYAIMHKIVNNLVPDPNAPYPLNNIWGYHDACSGNGHYELYYNDMVKRLGKPVSLKDFCDKMQIMNADGYRGIFESAGHKLNETGGVMLWKLNAAFPSVIWQVYDWYMEPNAGYYFMQRACEPVHVQLNLDDSFVTVVNRIYTAKNDLAIEASIVDLNGVSLFSKKEKLSAKGPVALRVFSLASELKAQNGLVFVVLKLADAKGVVISRNVYWMQKDHDYTSLTSMKPATVKVKVLGSKKDKDMMTYQLQFSNNGSQMAFFIHPQIVLNGEEILPSFWSDSYFSLLSKESVMVSASVPVSKLNGMQPSLAVDGWNSDPQELKLPK